jgi:hypothetical protein
MRLGSIYGMLSYTWQTSLGPPYYILRSSLDPAIPKPIIPPVPTIVSPSASTKSVADRLNEIEDLRNRKLLTDPEYQDKRAKIIAEL